ncbi:MAG: hypothetical protein V4793_15920 [Paraburkholderia tropica]|uniref:Uncharacterized protein n=1 Tax=Paraburkholderia tropica TaxID=92647 RepID=A0ABX5MEA9_9BURK|nr:hypothetical protein [Paraburkholderia tropica]MBB3004683.1 alkylhydroperoxidase/carboxymuconolactone decarboxylase family protein YurZ [Paraburkholderia tropica]MBB6323481.1 alkylhydroperoxidase/carboxymuconolactone decarboxylase family protein YurZ [Paraburkholderia tropica]PXX03457.1 hypothetical protein C7400_1498 [Paraburkholderia tropica]PZW69376.1 hypothetical protein C7399_1498 [Paraburkholderia tropica]
MTKLLHLDHMSEESRALIYMAAIVGVGCVTAVGFVVRAMLKL